MRKVFLTILVIVISFTLHSTLTTKLRALTFQYPEYNVDVTIERDSSFRVVEKAVYKVFGEFHGLRRDLTLADPQRDRLCTTQNNLYCGGFDRVIVNSVKDLNGNDITDKVKLYTVEESKNSLRFEWEIYSNGKDLNGEQYGWILDYSIYGGIVSAEEIPYFYWNMLPEERNGLTDKSRLTVTLPVGSNFRQDNLSVFTDLDFKNNFTERKIIFDLSNLPSYAPFTIAYRFNKNEIDLPGQIAYNLLPGFGSQILLNGTDVTDQVDGVIKAVPSGENTVTFKHIGYETIEKKVVIEPNETEMLDISLKPTPFMQFLLFLNNLICLCGCLLIPFALIGVVYNYRKNGRDANMPKTIIPLFAPPKDSQPYMVGSVLDEQVDRQDIVGSIIDLAYRGYIKIKELEKNQNYELTKLAGKADDKGLNPIETDIYNALFKLSDVVETKELGSTFPTDYYIIQTKVYAEMVAKGYFNKQPNTTISNYFAGGLVLTVLGVASLVLLTSFLIYFLGILTVFTPSLVMIFTGIALIVVAKYMPAKTSKGSKLLAEILGFKMYMNTAEKFTVQKLKPEDFVKYLSYAIVFGIEKEWAKNFEDIYKGTPDWYEGTGGIYDAIWISSFARSFSNSTIQNMTPVSSSSSSGNGWSGGGSFGGFSGGGGGGGSSGGW